MATIKLIFRLLVYTSVFTITTVHQVRGETAKDYVVNRCFNFIKNSGTYGSPDHYCLMACTMSDMTYICRLMTAKDQKKISMAKFVCLAQECRRPVPPGTKCASAFFGLYYVLIQTNKCIISLRTRSSRYYE